MFLWVLRVTPKILDRKRRERSDNVEEEGSVDTRSVGSRNFKGLVCGRERKKERRRYM